MGAHFYQSGDGREGGGALPAALLLYLLYRGRFDFPPQVGWAGKEEWKLPGPSTTATLSSGWGVSSVTVLTLKGRVLSVPSRQEYIVSYSKNPQQSVPPNTMASIQSRLSPYLPANKSLIDWQKPTPDINKARALRLSASFILISIESLFNKAQICISVLHLFLYFFFYTCYYSFTMFSPHPMIKFIWPQPDNTLRILTRNLLSRSLLYLSSSWKIQWWGGKTVHSVDFTIPAYPRSSALPHYTDF